MKTLIVLLILTATFSCFSEEKTNSTSTIAVTNSPSTKDLIYTGDDRFNEEGQKIIKRLRNDIEEYSFPYDITKIKSEFDVHPIPRAAYLKGFIQGYIWGKEKKEASFPFHHEDEKLTPAMMNGYYSGQYHGLRGEDPQ
ncbi:MAG: hypothetical protein WC701_13625 [Kiritimatiellales bacterium]|jgi:hypothetical protein